MYVISVILFFVVIFVVVQAFLGLRVNLETRDLERFAFELEENIFSSPLTVDRAVFNVEELKKFDSPDHKIFSDGNVVGAEEPYVRNCKYGYYISVKDLDIEDQPNQWEFGYRLIETQKSQELNVIRYFGTTETFPTKYPVSIVYS